MAFRQSSITMNIPSGYPGVTVAQASSSRVRLEFHAGDPACANTVYLPSTVPASPSVVGRYITPATPPFILTLDEHGPIVQAEWRAATYAPGGGLAVVETWEIGD